MAQYGATSRNALMRQMLSYQGSLQRRATSRNAYVNIAVVVILVMRFFRREFFEPTLKVAVQAALVVVYKHTCRDVHGVHKAQALADSALGERGFDLRRDVDISAASLDIVVQFFPV